MSIRCPRCGREFDITLFEFDRSIDCPCGERLSAEMGHTIRGDPALERALAAAAELAGDRDLCDRIRLEADRITASILDVDMPAVDIEIAVRAFRRLVLEHLPEKEELFEAVYVARFRRLWAQFRPGERPILDD